MSYSLKKFPRTPCGAFSFHIKRVIVKKIVDMEYSIDSLTRKEFIPHLREFQSNNKRERGNFNLSQYWLPDLSDEAFEYALYRNFINVASIKGRFIGFSIAFSPLIKFLEKKSGRVIDIVSQSLDEHQSALYVSTYITHLSNDTEVFGNLITELFMKVHTRGYFSQLVMLEQRNPRLYTELVHMEFELTDSISLQWNKIPETNVFTYNF